MLLAIDVGNTLVKVYNLDRGGTLTFETPSIIDVENAKKVINPGVQKDIRIIGASVVPKVEKLIDRASKEILKVKPVWIDASMPLGLKIEYKTPETLGADRLANVLGAFEVCEPPFIVVDLGTATKFEVVDQEGRYLGGSIMPSAQMGLRSLRFETAQLPTVQLEDHLSQLIGSDTKSAILTGAVLGHRYGVEGLINHYFGYLAGGIAEIKKIGPEAWLEKVKDGYRPFPVNAVITGGAAKDFPSLQRKEKGLTVHREPMLTAMGLAAAAKRLGI